MDQFACPCPNASYHDIDQFYDESFDSDNLACSLWLGYRRYQYILLALTAAVWRRLSIIDYLSNSGIAKSCTCGVDTITHIE